MTAQPKLTRLPPLEVEDDWHAAHAAAAETDVRAIERWLQETLVLTELLEGDQLVERALGAAAALLRCRRNDLADEARRLRAVIASAQREG